MTPLIEDTSIPCLQYDGRGGVGKIPLIQLSKVVLLFAGLQYPLVQHCGQDGPIQVLTKH